MSMEVNAKHIQLRHQLTDDLQIEQAYTCYMDGDAVYSKSVLCDGFADHFNPILDHHKQRYQQYRGNHLVLSDVAYPAQYNDNSTTTTYI